MEAVELLESQHEQSQRSDIYQEDEPAPEPSVGRFPVLQNEEKENIVEDANSKATKRQTKYGVNILHVLFP